MKTEDMIPAPEFCIHHNIELSFIHSLQEYGLIETIIVEENIFLPAGQLERLEKLVRLHYELDINLEGIESIAHLLDRVNQLQDHIVLLTNRLRKYEDE